MAADADPSERSARTATTVIALVGLLLIAAPFLLGHAFILGALANQIVVGALLVALAVVRYVSLERGEAAGWTAAGVGIWLLIAPFVLRYATQANAAAPNVTADALTGAAGLAMWTDLLVGSLLIIIGVWGARASRQAWV